MVKGERVEIMMKKIIKYKIKFKEVMREGLVVVKVNKIYKKREIEKKLKDEGEKEIVVMEKLEKKVEKEMKQINVKNIIVD